MRRPDYACRDCKADTDEAGEFAYVLKDRVWAYATKRARAARGPGGASCRDLLCIGCLEQRMGRPLVATDFEWSVPLNWTTRAYRSPLLLARMGAGLAAARRRRAATGRPCRV